MLVCSVGLPHWLELAVITAQVYTCLHLLDGTPKLILTVLEAYNETQYPPNHPNPG